MDTDFLPGMAAMPPALLDFLITFGAVLLAVVAALVWAVFFRKKMRWRRSRHRTNSGEPSGKADSEFQPSVRKRRRHRRDSGAAYPTLAQAGGLPAARLPGPEGPDTPRRNQRHE